MNKEKQLIAIAKVHGWRWIWESSPANYFRLYAPKGFLKGFFYADADPDADFPVDMLTDYLKDLNAMSEAKKKLNSTTSALFAHYLAQIVLGYGFDDADEDGTICLNGWATKRLISATAAQQAEAFLRALNLWEEEA